MQHFDEHTLELFVLGSRKVDSRHGEIESHLTECSGCRAMVEELRAIHADLANELESEEAPVSQERSLAHRRQHLARYSEEGGAPMRYTPRTPMQKVRYFIVRYPVAAAVAGISFAAIFIGLGMLMSIPFKQASATDEIIVLDRNPAFSNYNDASATLEILNADHQVLWFKKSPEIRAAREEERARNIERTVIRDLDGDGNNEVITTIHVLGVDPPSGSEEGTVPHARTQRTRGGDADRGAGTGGLLRGAGRGTEGRPGPCNQACRELGPGRSGPLAQRPRRGPFAIPDRGGGPGRTHHAG